MLILGYNLQKLVDNEFEILLGGKLFNQMLLNAILGQEYILAKKKKTGWNGMQLKSEVKSLYWNGNKNQHKPVLKKILNWFRYQKCTISLF